LTAQRTKFDKKAKKCVFLGYQRGTRGYLLYNLHNREIFLSRNIEFYENNFPFYQSEKHENHDASISIHNNKHKAKI